MAEVKYEKLDRIREDIKRDRARVAKLQEQIRTKEAKLKEAEANQIVADVGAMNMTPEQLGEFLALIQNGGLNGLLNGSMTAGNGNGAGDGLAAGNETDTAEDKDLNDDEFYDNEEDTNDED